MGLLPVVIDILDASGAPVSVARSDGTRSPQRIEFGAGFTVTSAADGGVDDVLIELDALAPSDVAPTPNTLVLRGASGEAKAAWLDSGANADLPLKRNGVTGATVKSTSIVFGTTMTQLTIADVANFKIGWLNKVAAGVGGETAIYGQKGSGANPGGVVKIGGGDSGDGTTIAGGTQIDLGAAVSHVSAVASFLVGGSSALNISRVNATSFGEAAADLTLIDSIDNQTIYRCPGGSAGKLGLAHGTVIGIGLGNDGAHDTVFVGSNGGYLAFNGNTPMAKPTVSGDPAGNTALLSLLGALDNLGLIIDGT